MKKMLGISTIICISVIILCSLTASAASGQCGRNVYWDLTDGTLTISGNGAMYDYDTAQEVWLKAERIIVEEGVTSIGDWAFVSCVYATDISLPSTLTSISAAAFPLAELRENGYWNGDMLYIDNHLIYGRTDKNTEVEIIEGTLTIADGAFGWDSALEKVTIPEGVLYIGEWAFQGCSALKEVHIGKSIYKIASDAFSSCDALTDVYYYGTANQAAAIPSLSTAFENAIIHCMVTYTIDNGTTVETITTPCGIQTAPEAVIEGADFDRWIDNNENTITFPYYSDKDVNITAKFTCTITYTGDYQDSFTVPYHTWLVPVMAPTGYTYSYTVNGKPIDGQKGIFIKEHTTIDIKQSVAVYTITYVGDNIEKTEQVVHGEDANPPVAPFGYTYYFTSDSYPWNGEEWNSTNITSDAYVTVTVTINQCGDDIYWDLKDGILTIKGSGEIWNYSYNNYAPWCSYSEDINSVVIHDGITTIGDYAFSQVRELTNVTLPDTLVSIGCYAFSACGIKSVTLPDGFKTIGEWAFNSCDKLTTVILPGGIEYIGTYAFGACEALTEISLPDSITYIDNYTFDMCSSLKTIKLPANLTSIGMGAFSRCPSLTSISLPDSVTSIGLYAFKYSGLKSIYLHEGITHIGNQAFYGCENLSSVTLDANITVVRDRAFYYCTSLTNIILPDSVTDIQQSAFEYCTSLTNIILPDSVTDIQQSAFEYCTSLSYIDLNNVKTIGIGAFHGCSALNNITLPKSLTTIGEDAFMSCHGLTQINIPVEIQSIGANAFNSCYNLTSVVVPVGSEAVFQQCFANAFLAWAAVDTIYYGGTKSECTLDPEHPDFEGITIRYFVQYTIEYGNNSYKELTCEGISTPPDVTIEGADLQGWYDESGNEITFPYYSDYDTTIYSQWMCKVTYTGDYQDTVTVPQGEWYALQQPPFGYTYRYFIDGIEWLADKYPVEEHLTIEVAATPVTYTITYTGDYEGSDTAEHSGEVALPIADHGYTYSFYANGLLWDGKGITSDLTVVVTRERALFTITYTGDYTGTDTAYYEGNVTLPTPPYGYTYSYTADGKQWDGKNIQDNVTVNVAQEPIIYTITYTEGYEHQDSAPYLTDIEYPQPPYGYTYTFEVDGEPWTDTQFTKDITVVVEKLPITYTVTYTGGYMACEYVKYTESANLPIPPYGYTYAFEVNGEQWTGESITADITVNVIKTPITYTITYTGDYEGSDYAEYMTDATLPVAKEGYVYRFTCKGEEWSGKEITDNVTVAVEELCDMAEISFNNLESMTVLGNSIYGEYYNNPYIPSYTLSEKAACRAYYDSSCTSECTSMALSRGENTLHFMVTAESGRYEIYKVIINHNLPESLGALITTQQIGASFVARFENEIPGNPKIEVYAGYDKTNLYIKTTSTKYDPERKLLTIAGGLEEDTYYWLKAYAYYGDTVLESLMLYDKTGTTLSSECLLISLKGLLAGGIIDHEKETVSGIRVANSISQIPVAAEVSKGADWKLYKRPNASIAEDKKIIDLTEYAGFEKTMYIKVTSEDGNHTKTYALTVYRQSKTAELPRISVSNAAATISVENGCTIYYTTDGSDPTLINGEIYTAPFKVQEGEIIKAIAKAADKDEVGDVVTLVVRESPPVQIEGDSFKRAANEYFFDLYLMSKAPIKGQLIIALYNGTTLNTLNIVPVDTEDIEKSILHTVYTAAPAEYCRVFMWDTEKGGLEDISNVYTYDY